MPTFRRPEEDLSAKGWIGPMGLVLALSISVLSCGRSTTAGASTPAEGAPGHFVARSPAHTEHQMRLVSAGEFLMGLTPEAEGALLEAGVLLDACPAAMPAHVVDLDSFYVDQFQVTVGDYVSYLNDLWFSVAVEDGQAYLSQVLLLTDMGDSLSGATYLTTNEPTKPPSMAYTNLETGTANGWRMASRLISMVGARRETRMPQERPTRCGSCVASVQGSQSATAAGPQPQTSDSGMPAALRI